MKVNYNIKDGYLTSFYTVPFDENKQTLEITSDDIKFIMTGKCKVKDGKLITDEAIQWQAEIAARNAKQKELNELESWMKTYEAQAIIYDRQIRLMGHSDIDISALDAEAEQKLIKINELRNTLK